MAQTANFTWPQGEDLSMAFRYREGEEGSEIIVDLSSGYALRMDIVVPLTKLRVYTFNTANIADVDSTQVGDQPDSLLEGVLTSGAGTTPNIDISVPRELTLPGGAVYEQMNLSTPVTAFDYDIFLRNTVNDKQAKILRGTITVEPSNTLWL